MFFILLSSYFFRMTSFDYYNWIILPLIIFSSRIFDVTLGTIRHIFIVRGLKKLAPVLGFFEVLVWIIVISQLMQNLNNVVCYFAWAGGFAFGTYIGLIIENRIAIGMQIIRVFTNENCAELILHLNQTNYGATIIDARGTRGPIKIVITIVKRKDIYEVSKIIRQHHPDAFYTIEDIRHVSKEVFFKNNKEESFLRKMFSSHK
ncbi:MAG: DUF2179 domain-containing protein [Bacteroidota bacterium]